MNTTIPPKPWRQLAEPTPVHSLQMLLIDRDDRLLLMHRSATVRSARNVWSFPSGIHEIGETMFNACARELQEELKLDPVPGAMMHLGCYENIMPEPEEPWHWILSVIAVVVPRPGATLDGTALVAALKDRIAHFKVPKRVHVVDELPRNTMGKVQKNVLRQQYSSL